MTVASGGRYWSEVGKEEKRSPLRLDGWFCGWVGGSDS